LGSAESVGSRAELFTTLDNDSKIFAKRFSPGRLSVTLPDPQNTDNSSQVSRPIDTNGLPQLAQIENRATRILRDLYAPPGVTINDSMQILHFHGQTGLYLEAPPGEASLNLFRVAHQSLVFALRKAVDTAAARNAAVHEDSIRFDKGGAVRNITIRVIPISEAGQRFYLILFEDRSVRQPLPDNPAETGPGSDALEDVATQESRELDETREYLEQQ
jgi:two-component system CheB/CheR fusion protein